MQFPCNGKVPPSIDLLELKGDANLIGNEIAGDANMIGNTMAGIYDFLATLCSKYVHGSCMEVAYLNQEFAHRSFLHRLAKNNSLQFFAANQLTSAGSQKVA